MAKQYPHRAELARELQGRRQEQGLSYAQLAAIAGVDAGHALRICSGRFVTLSPSVLKLCGALGIYPKAEDMRMPPHKAAPDAERLRSAVLAAWDETPEGAETLISLLRVARRLRNKSVSQTQ